MGPRVLTLALLALVLLLVAAVDAHQKPAHATRHGGRVGAAHRIKEAHRNKAAKAAPVARKATRVSHGQQQQPELVTLKATNVIEFDFGDNGTLAQELMDSGRYDPKMVIAYDMTMDDLQRNRIFVTSPLTRRGIPMTLWTIPYDRVTNQRIMPYPNFDIQRTMEDTITDCNTQLVDVFRTTKTWADDDTLYALDNGALDLTTGIKNVCPPKIVIFDLRTDEITNSIVIENAACNSFYSYLWVDACPDGSLTAYSSDMLGNVLTVTDLATGDSKHLQSQYFHPKPGYFFANAGGPRYYLPYGMNGLTADQSCDGKLYFTACSTNIQGVVDKQVIRDASDGDVLDIVTQVALPGELSALSALLVGDPTGELLFFPIQDETAIYCWNTTKPHDPENFRMIAQDPERLQFTTSINLQPETHRLYVLTDRLTSYLTNTTNYSEDNYRILYIDIQDIKC